MFEPIFPKLPGLLAACLVLGACSSESDQPEPAPTTEKTAYDLVLAGGRIMDPDSGLDAVRNVGINEGTIVVISESPLEGKSTIDIAGLVVAPGFIDLHSHSWTALGQQFQVRDGVTTAFELESGAYPVAQFGTFDPIAIAGQSLINYGASMGHAWARWHIKQAEQPAASFGAVLTAGMNDGLVLGMDGPTFTEPMTENELPELRRMLLDGLNQGGLGIGMLLDYMSEAVGEAEMRVVFEVAAERSAPIIVHIRRGIAGDPTGLHEVIELAEQTGAQVHVCHIQASAMNNIAEFLRLIREANGRGVRITTESFPYNAGSTSNTAAVFNRNWREVFAIDYEDVEWAATGERFNEAMWHEYREKYPGGLVIHHYNKEEWTKIATEAPDVIAAADGAPILSLDSKVAPFGQGTYARTLGRYTQGRGGSLTLMEALAKMTILPARVLQDYVPALLKKGRIQVSADADITVFDPTNIIDNATFQDPYQASTGIQHVIVAGEFVVFDGALLEDVFPGKRVLATTD